MGNKDLSKTKKQHKKGLWSPDEDQKLYNHIIKHGHGYWSSVPINAGLQRNGKSCRLRWINYLRPGLKRGMFSIEEEDKILNLHQNLGNKWSLIANNLHGRTDNEIKNYWHSYLKKRVENMAATASESKGKDECLSDPTQRFETSPSSAKSTISGYSSHESCENLDGSETITDQSMQQTANENKYRKGNLPRLLFAEWLSLDNFHPKDIASERTINSPDFKNSNSQEASSSSSLLNEQAFSCEMDAKSSCISVDDFLQSSFKFEHQEFEGCLIDCFPDEFTINYEDMFI